MRPLKFFPKACRSHLLTKKPFLADIVKKDCAFPFHFSFPQQEIVSDVFIAMGAVNMQKIYRMIREQLQRPVEGHPQHCQILSVKTGSCDSSECSVDIFLVIMLCKKIPPPGIYCIKMRVQVFILYCLQEGKRGTSIIASKFHDHPRPAAADIIICKVSVARPG